MGLGNRDIFDVNVSSIAPRGNNFSSPSKGMDKKEKLKGLHLDMNDNITAYKTVKKDLGSKIVEETIEPL